MNSRLHALRWFVFGEVAFCSRRHRRVSVRALTRRLRAGRRHDRGWTAREYGVHVKTAVLYTLAWAVLAGGNMRAARAHSGRGVRSEKVRKLLLAYSVATSLVLVSTYFYSLDAVLKYIHYGLGAPRQAYYVTSS